MTKNWRVTLKDLPIVSIPLFVLGLALVFLNHQQFIALIAGNNVGFIVVLMIFGPGCLFAVSFITTFFPALCRSHLLAYIALISGVEIGIAAYLGFAATQWYIDPELARIEPTVVSMTLIIGCLQWSKRKWEIRVQSLLAEQNKTDA